jgi:hypothetical protein
MKIKEIYDFNYEVDTEELTIQFSLENDSEVSYRILNLDNEGVISNLPLPSLIDDMSVEEILEDEDYIYDILEHFLSFNENDVPEEEIL